MDSEKLLIGTRTMQIYLLVGNIASGKSTFVKQQLDKEPDTLIVNDDLIVKAVHGNDYTLYNTKFKKLYKEIEYRIIQEAILQKVDLIIDRPCNKAKTRKRYTEFIRSFYLRKPTINFINFEFEGSFQHAIRRYKTDARGYSIEDWVGVADRIQSQFDPIDETEDFDQLYQAEYQEGKICLKLLSL